MIDLDALGAMLRAARERLGMHPIDLALAMGWSGTAPVDRYERGGPRAPRPAADTINQLARVLELDYADRVTLLGFAGHIPDTEPLTPVEEARILGWALPELEATAQPALLFDYRWRILTLNAACRRWLGRDEATVATWRFREVTTLDLVWDPACELRPLLDDPEATGELQLLRFKLYNRLRRHEAWYRAYPACRGFLPGFTEAWERTEAVLAKPLLELELEAVVRGGTVGRLPSGERLRFEASQRAVHGAYGLVGTLVLMPLDQAAGTAMRATPPPNQV